MKDKLLTVDNFQLALIRLKTANRNFYKELYYDDMKIFELFSTKNCETLVDSIKNNIYHPKSCHKLYIPKKGNLIRPLSLLTFEDMVVYQAIMNVIADEVYDKIAPLYNKRLFGNQIYKSDAPEKDRIFFFQNWKSKWKNFNDKTKKYYDDGYEYLMEFDLASFFDTIDHTVLREILRVQFNIDEYILDLLSKCLKAWTGDSNIAKFTTSKGIPQGPIASGFLADLFLTYMDEQFLGSAIKKVKYLRYVDDIRIFSKDENTANRSIATLDLLSRDLGLIPQSSKIQVKKINNDTIIGPYLKSGFSQIAKEYKSKNRELKSKTHKKLAKTFKSCFEESNELYLNKTVIGFSLFKLNDDDEIRDLLVNNYKDIHTHSAGVFYYLSRHYRSDPKVIEFIKDLLEKENDIFHHTLALVYKSFPEIEFDTNQWNRFFQGHRRSWIVRYFMLDWAEKNSKRDLLMALSDENYFVQRKINKIKFKLSNDNAFKSMLATELIAKQGHMESLQGLSLLFMNILPIPRGNMTVGNNYTGSILVNNRADYINYILQTDYGVENSSKFFNANIWTDEEEYREMSNALWMYNQTRNLNPSTALIQLNFFNNLVYDKLCKHQNIVTKSSDYGVNLNAGYINGDFPFTNSYWSEINNKRNQKTEAHPYDRDGNIRVQITDSELGDLHNKFIQTLEELSSSDKI